jgi:FAD/FMN-containing dehydrogenase/Fe-S oxidoreductase
MVIDFARHNRGISDLDLERRTVKVEAGVVLDQLNGFLRKHGFCFGPDVATSSRATLGGMIANDSSGSHTPYYGTTADHVCDLDVVLANGRVVRVGPQHDTLVPQRELVKDLVYFHSLELAERMGTPLVKRRPGYAIHRCVTDPENMNHLLCGSEGTLAVILSAVLRISPLPARKGLTLLFFASVEEAMQATVEMLDLKPAAVEHIDRVLLDQTRGQREFAAARELLELDFMPCQSILAVEFFEDVDDRMAELRRRKLGLRTLVLGSTREAGLVWSLRKAGLSLMTGRKGPAKPATCIEDTAVHPRKLPDYVAALQSLMARLGLEASYYGHAASGLLHVRPILDLHTNTDTQKLRQVSDEVSSLVRQFKGSIAGEHGVGIARTEYMAEQVGEHLLGAMAEVKHSFDPNNVLNPGKIVTDGRYLIDTNLRSAWGRPLWQPPDPVLAFAAKDESLTGNIEQCNGCGGCRKDAPIMCPTFPMTGDESLTTRGRVNLVRTALESQGGNGVSSQGWAQLEEALSSCLSCKACSTECPSNVNLALIKAELTHAHAQEKGLSLSGRLFSSVDQLGRLGSVLPGLANWTLDRFVVRAGLSKLLGLAWQRPLPHYGPVRFDRWFAKRTKPISTRGRVVLWDDTFVRYHEPHVGMAAVRLLEAAGFEVVLPAGRECCGRPAFSQGHLDRVKRLGSHNLALLLEDPHQSPVLFLEPSCYSMFAEDYREMQLPGAEKVADRCFLFEQFLEDLLDNEPSALRFRTELGRVLIHAHCHVKALMKPGFMERLARRLPGYDVRLLDSGCCGMAGAFGMMESKYELSLQVAEPLLRELRSQPYGTTVVASGTSCRQQLSHLSTLRVCHMAELLAQSLEKET